MNTKPCDDSDAISVQGMAPFLLDKGLADRIFVHPVLESTNKTAKQMAMSDAAHGTIIIADSQTAGRGRRGRSFFSPRSRGIYMSLILHPAKLKLDMPTLITSFAAVAVCEAVEVISAKKPRIKWVNDIFLEGKKICGILTEAVQGYETGSAQWIVVGIGINFSTGAADFPEDLRQIAGAVFLDEKPACTRNRLVAEIANRMLAGPYDRARMLAEYKKRVMMLGERIVVIGAAKTYEAVAVDIDEAGCLIVKKDDGQVALLSSGEISIRGAGN